MKEINIEEVSNGYILRDGSTVSICETLEDIFDYLLLHYEGLYPFGKGNSFGEVIINRGTETKQFPKKE